MTSQADSLKIKKEVINLLFFCCWTILELKYKSQWMEKWKSPLWAKNWIIGNFGEGKQGKRREFTKDEWEFSICSKWLCSRHQKIFGKI